MRVQVEAEQGEPAPDAAVAVYLLRLSSGVCPKSTYPGWVWLTGYQLDERGDAVDKREIFVRLAGLHAAHRTLRFSLSVTTAVEAHRWAAESR